MYQYMYCMWVTRTLVVFGEWIFVCRNKVRSVCCWYVNRLLQEGVQKSSRHTRGRAGINDLSAGEFVLCWHGSCVQRPQIWIQRTDEGEHFSFAVARVLCMYLVPCCIYYGLVLFGLSTVIKLTVRADWPQICHSVLYAFCEYESMYVWVTCTLVVFVERCLLLLI